MSFAVADQWFALEAQSVQAVLEANRLEVINGDSADVLGCVEARGQKVLVRDMTDALVPGSASKPAEQIIVLRGAKSWAGLITASTAEILDIAQEQIKSKQALDNSKKWIKGTCQIEGRTVTVLDAEALVESIGNVC